MKPMSEIASIETAEAKEQEHGTEQRDRDARRDPERQMRAQEQCEYHQHQQEAPAGRCRSTSPAGPRAHDDWSFHTVNVTSSGCSAADSAT